MRICVGNVNVYVCFCFFVVLFFVEKQYRSDSNSYSVTVDDLQLPLKVISDTRWRMWRMHGMASQRRLSFSLFTALPFVVRITEWCRPSVRLSVPFWPIGSDDGKSRELQIRWKYTPSRDWHFQTEKSKVKVTRAGWILQSTPHCFISLWTTFRPIN